MHLLANRLSFFFGIKIHLLYFFLPRSSRKNAHSSLRYFGIRGIAGTSFSLPIADLLPKRRNAQNLTPLYGFGAILGVFFRYERLCFDGGILYRQPFKSRCLSLPGNKKAPYCYDAFVLLGRWSKGTLFNYLLYFFFLLTTVVPMAAPLLTNSRAIHSARLLVSPVWGSLESSFSFAVTVSAFLISLVPSLSL